MGSHPPHFFEEIFQMLTQNARLNMYGLAPRVDVQDSIHFLQIDHQTACTAARPPTNPRTSSIRDNHDTFSLRPLDCLAYFLGGAWGCDYGRRGRKASGLVHRQRVSRPKVSPVRIHMQWILDYWDTTIAKGFDIHERTLN